MKQKDELELYKSLYFGLKKKLDRITQQLRFYDYLLPDEYRTIIREIYTDAGVIFK